MMMLLIVIIILRGGGVSGWIVIRRILWIFGVVLCAGLRRV